MVYTPAEDKATKVAARKERSRWARILRVYGITKEQYEELDHGKCHICLREWNETVRPAVDHDHSNGVIRGLICLYCNRYRVGRHRDAELVQRIADYLRGPFKGWIVPPKPKKRRKKTPPKRKKIK